MEEIAKQFAGQFLNPQGIFVLVLGIFLLYKLVSRTIIMCKLRKTKDNSTNQLVPVTVVVCARNEEANLQRFLPRVLMQNYPNYEVVVVNDASKDNSELVLISLQKEYTNLRYTTIPPDPKFDHGKKLAQTIGIKSANYEHIVLIDADCIPATNNWLKGIAGHFDTKEVVLGYGAYQVKKGILNKLIRFDTISIATKYMGMAAAGMPYMGVGRNLAYTKQLFQSVQGHKKHHRIRSGDDDLLINQIATSKNTAVNYQEDCFTYSKPANTLKKWLRQKQRHLSTGSKYKFKHKIYLGVESLEQILFYPAFVAGLVLLKNFQLSVTLMFAGTILFDLFYWKWAMNKFHEKGFWLLTPFFGIFIAILSYILVLKNYLESKHSRWN